LMRVRRRQEFASSSPPFCPAAGRMAAQTGRQACQRRPLRSPH
jgi:hypothetical protein